MRVRLTQSAQKQFRNLPREIQKKTRKQFGYLVEDIRHPSLHAKKYQEGLNLWQGRIDKNWRFYFHIIEPHYIVISIIMHPK
jgi:mRNA-degrading endonuclease RelE of RelBE toxin-antitoxin system